MRRQARALFDCGVAAADPGAAVATTLGAHPPVAVSGDIFLLALGKAAGKMARAGLDHLPDVKAALVVTNYENAQPVAGCRVYASGHPVPDGNGARAALDVIEMLEKATENDMVVVLVSGGGSALLPAPLPGITLADKARVGSLLLGSGADIGAMNTVRQQLSRLKGGGLVRMAAPAAVYAVILSDVIGDDLQMIASGPTVQATGTRRDAVAILRRYGLWDDIPQSVRALLTTPAPDPGPFPDARNRLAGSNGQSVRAMQAFAPAARVFPVPLVGDVGRAAVEVVKAGDETGRGVLLFGGETTVQLQGSGLGGRNQELALRVALLARDAGWGRDWVFLSGGTDGRDGPCDAAGGVVDGTTLARIGDAGLSVADMLANNDSYHALKPVGDLLMTGATGTNVADLQILIRA
jgi:hydroxypyruvate reductase